jgi:hypothetical protein
MNENLAHQSHLGDIHLTTQLVNVEIGNENVHLDDIYPDSSMQVLNNSKNKNNNNANANVSGDPDSKKRRLYVRSKSVELGSGQLSFTLFKASAGNSWWPFKILLLSTMKSYKPRQNTVHGYIFANPNGFLIKFIGSLEDESETAERSPLSMVLNCMENQNCFVKVPYSQVHSFIDVSSACVHAVIKLHTIQENSYPVSFSIELLIGPCPAEKLCQILTIRSKYYHVRQEINKLLSMLGPTTKSFRLHTPNSSSFLGGNSGTRKSGSVYKDRILSDLSLESTEVSASKNVTSEDDSLVEELLATTRNLFNLLEFNYNIGNRQSSSNAVFQKWEKTYILLLLAFLRNSIISRFYKSFSLLYSPAFPGYTREAIKFVIDREIQETQLLTLLNENSGPSEIKDRLNLFLQNSVDTVKDFLLFASKIPLLEQDSLLPLNTSQSKNSPNPMSFRLSSGSQFIGCGEELFVNDSVRGSVEFLLNSYYDAFQRAFQLYHLFDKEKYLKDLKGPATNVNGKENYSFNPFTHTKLMKLNLLSFLIEKNDFFFGKCIQLIEMNFLSYVHLETVCKFSLFSGLNELIQWFYLESFHDLKALILKLFTENTIVSGDGHVSSNRVSGKLLSSIRTPWTIAMDLNGYYIASIPEILQAQLSVLVDFYLKLKQPTFAYNSLLYQQQVSSYEKIGKKILLIIYNSWLLVGHEYYRTIQNIHEEIFETLHNVKSSGTLESFSVSSLTVMNQNVVFMISILNDCVRIINDYFPVVKDISTNLISLSYVYAQKIHSNDTNSKSANSQQQTNIVLRTLKNDSYDIIIEQILLCTTKIIFSTALHQLMKFEETWGVENVNSKNNFNNTFIIQIICDNFLFYFQNIKSAISNAKYLLSIVYLVEETIIARYFLFIRERLQRNDGNNEGRQNSYFTKEQVLQFQKDFNYLSEFFEVIEAEILQQVEMQETLEVEKMSKKSAKQYEIHVGTTKDNVFISCLVQWNLSPLSYLEHFLNLLLEPKESFEFNSSLKFLVSKYDNDAIVYSNHDISVFLDYFLLHVILPLRSSLEQSESDKSGLYQYFIKILDGNHEDIYRQTNSYCPIHLETTSAHPSTPKTTEVEDHIDIENQFFKRDMFWRSFSSELYLHNEPTEEIVDDLQSPRDGNVDSHSLHDALQSAFQGLFHFGPSGTSNSNNNHSNHEILSPSSHQVAKKKKKKFAVHQTNLIIDNIRQSANDFIHRMNLNSSHYPSVSGSTGYDKSSQKTRLVKTAMIPNEETLYRLLGLEICSFHLSEEAKKSFNSNTQPAPSGKDQAESKVASHHGNIANDLDKSSHGPHMDDFKLTREISSKKGKSLFQTPTLSRGDSSKGASIFSGFFSPGKSLNKSQVQETSQHEPQNDNKVPGSEPSDFFKAVPRPSVVKQSSSIKQTLEFLNESDFSENSPMKELELASNSSPSGRSVFFGDEIINSKYSVEISEISFKNIYSESFFSTKPDPYVYFILPEDGNYSKKTTVLSHKSSGTFPDIIKLPYLLKSKLIDGTMEEKLKSTIQIRIYDKEKIRRKVLRGFAEFNIFQYFPRTYVQYHDLRNGREDDVVTVTLSFQNPKFLKRQISGINVEIEDAQDGRFGEISFRMKLVGNYEG